MIKENIVTLERVKKEEFDKFKVDLQESFAVAVIETFGSLEDGPIPSDKDIEECFYAPKAVPYDIVANGKIVGGVVVSIDETTNHNSLDFLFICKDEIGKGYGYKAWKEIEEKYPETEVWETGTPYFEKRNIHFYVNKCGFKIVEFYNEHNPDPHMTEGEELSEADEFFGDDGFFIFEMVMKK